MMPALMMWTDDEWREIVQAAQEERRLRQLAKTTPAAAMGDPFIVRANRNARHVRGHAISSLRLLAAYTDPT